MKTISDIIDRDIISAIYGDNFLIKKSIERIFPELDFSGYQITIENNIELIDEWALLNELMKNDQCFREKILLMLDDYKQYGFFGDDEFCHKIFTLASGYEENIEEMINIGNLEIDNCFYYSTEIMERSMRVQGRSSSKKQKQRCNRFRKKSEKEEEQESINKLIEEGRKLF